MPDWTLVNRSHVLAALAEHDRLGSREFLSRYSFGRSRAYTLWHNGQEYDSKAILGVAYLHATGTAATRDEFRGGLSGASAGLARVGFGGFLAAGAALVAALVAAVLVVEALTGRACSRRSSRSSSCSSTTMSKPRPSRTRTAPLSPPLNSSRVAARPVAWR